jgi:Tol biopolymer transport system component
LLAHAPHSQLGDMAHSGGQRFHWNSTGTALILETETNNGLQNLWNVHVDPATLEWVSVERLTTGSGTDVAAAVSPDGTRVVFGTQHVSERLWRFAFDPVRHHLSSGQPTSEEGATLIGADITTDGRWAVYHLARPGGDPPTIGIWRMDLDSRRSELLLTDAQFPRWSPNRRRIAYTRFRPETNDPRTVATLGALGVREEGGVERLISQWTTDRWLGACDWVSDDSVLACAGQQIVEWPVLDTPATGPSRVVFAQRETDMDSATFSPNRRWISFVLRRPSERDRSVLGVTSAEGPPERPWRSLVPDHPWVAVPRWAPDGKTLYFLSTRSGSLNLWGVAFDPKSGRAVGDPFAVSNFESPAFSVSTGFWSQMSVLFRQVFLTIHTAKGNIWMLDNVDR